jgi:hypothetical protein
VCGDSNHNPVGGWIDHHARKYDLLDLPLQAAPEAAAATACTATAFSGHSACQITGHFKQGKATIDRMDSNYDPKATSWACKVENWVLTADSPSTFRWTGGTHSSSFVSFYFI